jgi:hypothetical protein
MKLERTLMRDDRAFRIEPDESAHQPVQVVAWKKTEAVNPAGKAHEVAGLNVVRHQLGRIPTTPSILGRENPAAPAGDEVVERLLLMLPGR